MILQAHTSAYFKTSFKIIFLFTSLVTLSSCQKKESNAESTEVALTPKQELGQMLFMDPRLSFDGTISCNSCHNVMSSGADHRSTSMGVKGQRGGRNSPTVFNAGFLSVQFWDGRAKDLVEQAKGPLINPLEMGEQSHFIVVDRIKKIEGYKPFFQKAFGEAEIDIDIEHVAQAIAEYEKTLVTLNSPYDKYIAGDKKALTEEQLQGWELFKSKGCVACHSGDHFAGPKLADGVGFYMKFPTFEDSEYVKKYNFKKDFGRYDATKNEADKHFYRVPTLRNIADTAPYFHNGSVMTLTEAIKVMGKVQLNQEINDEEANKIQAFLASLSGTIKPQKMPYLPQTKHLTVVDPK